MSTDSHPAEKHHDGNQCRSDGRVIDSGACLVTFSGNKTPVRDAAERGEHQKKHKKQC